VARPIPKPVETCVQCGHSEQEHGHTGTHPCLAMVGDLLHREFCACNAYRAKIRKAA